MLVQKLQKEIQNAFQSLFNHSLSLEEITFQQTRKEFEGSYTFVTFPYSRISKKKPEETATLLGEFLKENTAEVKDFNVVKGFLNLVLEQSVWVKTLVNLTEKPSWESIEKKDEKVMVEYSSPNTNKPLHLGHLRNNFLGYSVSEIMAANGSEVMKVNLVNDRGIHICKSMLAYKKHGEGKTPQDLGIKGDKLVGDYYVKFNDLFKAEVQELVEAGQPKEKAEKEAPILKEAQQMLLKWEQGDKETTDLWAKMNGWVYEGFDATYKSIGVEFDKFYYESNTYLLGKDIIEEGLEKGVFFKKDDGSVWIDLTKEKLDEKLVLRGDGTSVYITQDIGTADLKYKDFPMQKSVYVVGNEQDYHFKVLFSILKKLGRSYAEGMYHLSYGMVELPDGKMKSREGTVVDADELVADMVEMARERTGEVGKIDDFTEEEAENLYKMLALGALKYYLLRVEPKKKMLFNPADSIDFQGNSGVYLQYTHAKICAILRKADKENISYSSKAFENLKELANTQEELIHLLSDYPNYLNEAAQNYAPSTIANYMYDVAKLYSKLYAEIPIFAEENEAKKALLIAISKTTAQTLKHAGKLLGIEMPERM
ncbi:arginine--tRNA ligase [Bernardetia sp.]|uniref:arginine--tRNA ligase n=1 Tax=Bernardetia sp. TaxID=1937974 RepID=UPI0025C07D03|nr:arginine--tRNA ligase [Bernardetia sp.]